MLIPPLGVPHPAVLVEFPLRRRLSSFAPNSSGLNSWTKWYVSSISPHLSNGRPATARHPAGLDPSGFGLALAAPLMGMSMAVIFLPSIVGGRSTLPTSASFSSTESSTRRPSS